MIKNEYDVRYVKLHFTLQIVEDTSLPIYKASAIRGGIGDMLLRSSCIRNRECEECDFETECIVRRIMYPQMEIQPEFMSGGESIGFVTECEDYREELQQGDIFAFNLILFGKTIVYFSQILNAVYALGMTGIGKEKARFQIVSVTNTKKKVILKDNDVLMENYQVEKISDYVKFRRQSLTQERIEIKFQTPLTLKYHGKELKQFDIEAVYEAACRRLYSLACLEGIDSDIRKRDKDEYPGVISEDHRQVSVRRYSNHQESAMQLKGIEGSLCISELPIWMADVMLAGELVHIGKNTSFGFGRYRIKELSGEQES